jgi:hypothetical protein
MQVTRLLPVAAFVVLGLAACGPDESLYVEQNERILSSLPLPEGVTEESVRSEPYYKDDAKVPEGYSTNAVYRVTPETTDEDVISFYIDSLGGSWKHCRHEIGIMNPVPAGATPSAPLGKILMASFIRDGATVSVNAQGLHPLTYMGTYNLGVDHNAHEDPCTGETLR